MGGSPESEIWVCTIIQRNVENSAGSMAGANRREGWQGRPRNPENNAKIGRMRITTWNVNGLRAVLGKEFLPSLAKIEPDVLCLQEVRARPEQLDPQALQQLVQMFPHTAWNPASRPGYSGVATLASQAPLETLLGLAGGPWTRTTPPGPDPLAEPEAVTAEPAAGGMPRFNVGAFDAEGRVIISRFPDFQLFNIYFPNGGRGLERVPFKLDFYACLLERCDDLHSCGQNVILCGDFNTSHRPIDLRNPKANEKNTGFLPDERAWIDRYLEHGFIDIYRQLYPQRAQYTWWTFISNARQRYVGWRLDYFLVSRSLAERISDVIIHDDILGSDHCPVTLVLQGG
jgi:exodeoxyribonuclease-3